jgi:very-short-patch-repair endonuclease
LSELIHTPSTQARTEAIITTMASRQHGVVTRRQLLRAGVSPDAVDRRAKAGRLQRVHQGVYLVGPIAPPHAQEMAAVLAYENAMLSHWSAARCWRILLAHEQNAVHVLLVGRLPVRRPGICAHAVHTLATDEVTTHEGIPITTPARTIYDLAARSDHRELERALAEAFALRLTDSDDIVTLVTRYPGRRGARRLQDLLERGSRPVLTRSKAEERFLALARNAQLQDPEVNVTLEGYEVDFLWRQDRLVVEIDGRAFHSSDRTFESDRRRDAVLLAAGLRVMRVTWRQMVTEPEALLVRLTRALVAPRG